MKRPIHRAIVLWAVFFAPIFAGLTLFAANPPDLRAENNPWGIMAPKSTSVPVSVIASIKESSVTYMRPGDVWVDEWIKTNGKCDECFKLRNAGIATILTLRNSGKTNPKSVAASQPPKDIGAYQKAVGEILENYRPAMIAIENEEDGGVYYSNAPDAPKEYAKQLSVACEEAQKRNMRCTNGGLTQDAAVILTWFQYVSLGQNAKACDYAKRTLAKGDAAAAEKYCKVKSSKQLPEKMRKPVEKARAMIQIYRHSSIDYVNLHWSDGNASAFKETVDFLRLATNKPVISNELGWGENGKAEDGTALMNAVKEKRMAYAVWHPTHRPGNKAIKTFIKENYP